MIRALWVVRSRPVESETKGMGLEFYVTNGWKFNDMDGISYARIAVNRKKATTKDNREKPLEQAITEAVEQGEEVVSILNHLELIESKVREDEHADVMRKMREMFPGTVAME